MDIYNLFYAILQSFITTDALLGQQGGALFANGYSEVVASLFISLLLLVGFLVLQGFGLSKMAKKRGIGKRWMAFVPFVNYLYIGKLAGDTNFFGHRVKRAGLYTMIAQIIAFVLGTLCMFFDSYRYIIQGATGSTDTLLTVANNFDLVKGYVFPIFDFIASILLFMLMMALYRKYAFKGYMWLSWATLFFPIARFVIVFVIRNNSESRYQYIFVQRERDNPNTDPYGYPYGQKPNRDPFDNRFGGNDTNKKPDDPFSEFSSSPSSNGDKNGDGSDDLFD